MIYESEDITVIAELNFALLRMNVYVNRTRFAVDHEETYRELILHYCILICFINGSRYRLAVDKSSVNEYYLKSPVASYKRCKSGIAFYSAAFVFEADRCKSFCRLFSVYRINGIKRRSVARCCKQRSAVLDKLYRYLRCYYREFLDKACYIHSFG